VARVSGKFLTYFLTWNTTDWKFPLRKWPWGGVRYARYCPFSQGSCTGDRTVVSYSRNM